MTITQSSIIINLIGSTKHIYFATNEIREYIFDMYLGYKVIEYKNIDQVLNRKLLPHDIYINQCDLLTYNELKKMHDLIQNTHSSQKIKSCSLLIQTNKNENNKYIQSFIGSPYIYNIYKLDNTIKQKHSLLFDIIIANNLKPKFK
jgi:hypothetical protein